jgi:MGT family glycosyltransferase
VNHIGLFCPVETGHLNTMLPLGEEMKRRGYRVTFIGVADAEQKVVKTGLEFRAIGLETIPQGSTEQLFAELGKLSGARALLYTLHWIEKSARVWLEEAPALLKEAEIDVLLVDQISPEGGTVAELLGIPFITVCSALPFNQEDSIPPIFTTWKYNPAGWARLRNRIVYQLTNPFGKALGKLRAEYRQKWQLPPESSPDSPLAILTQQPAEFEYPRKNLPDHFYFTGPYHSQVGRPKVDFPWEKLTDRPLIYASMGTLQNRLGYVFESIAAACEGLDAQLVISLGGASLDTIPPLPGNPLVVSYAPQLELLQTARLAITHAGMNTALECLTYGVPMVAIPVTNDQPGVAARIAWTGAGELIPLGKLTTDRLKNAVRRVLREDSYQHHAQRLQQAIERAGGVQRAGDLIEQAIGRK